MKNKVIKGDCLEIMNNIENNSIDMILCDLPYGTTAIACLNTKRNYILIEKEEMFYNTIIERIKNHVSQQRLF